MRSFKLFAIAAAFGMAPPRPGRNHAPPRRRAAPAAAPWRQQRRRGTEAVAAPSRRAPGIGQPTAEDYGLQQPVSLIGVRGLWFDWILMPLIIAISASTAPPALGVLPLSPRRQSGADPQPTTPC
jgi:hypothetical protein